MQCPKCKNEITHNNEECPDCGIIISKFKERPPEIETFQPPTIESKSPKKGKMGFCKECGWEVSVKAKVCPQCGAVLPRQSGALGCLGVMFLIYIILWGYGQFNKITSKKHTLEPTSAPQEQQKAEKERKRAEREQQRAEEYERCKTDLKCWSKEHDVNAILEAQPIIERMAKYQFEWTDRMFEPKLSHFKWHDINKLTVTYIGDKIKMQNGFGAWQNMIYEVDYDPINKKVIDIRLRAGRL